MAQPVTDDPEFLVEEVERLRARVEELEAELGRRALPEALLDATEATRRAWALLDVARRREDMPHGIVHPWKGGQADHDGRVLVSEPVAAALVKAGVAERRTYGPTRGLYLT